MKQNIKIVVSSSNNTVKTTIIYMIKSILSLYGIEVEVESLDFTDNDKNIDHNFTNKVKAIATKPKVIISEVYTNVNL